MVALCSIHSFYIGLAVVVVVVVVVVGGAGGKAAKTFLICSMRRVNNAALDSLDRLNVGVAYAIYVYK